jgi:hypothetical protein
MQSNLILSTTYTIMSKLGCNINALPPCQNNKKRSDELMRRRVVCPSSDVYYVIHIVDGVLLSEVLYTCVIKYFVY